ncbi:MAG TPA: hypothetical protein VIF60_07755 [Burkholderiaceae bacterium]|jgi:hypothetical protein
MSQRDEYIAKMKLQLDEINLSIAEFEAKAHAARKDAETTYQEGLAKLRLESKLALDKLEELKAAGEGTWDKLVIETDKLRDAFVHSYHYFKSHF